ncbi:MAG: hypothetical protein PHX83_06555 [Acidobacteriia bacterium]|nr:hypothetical protein [Terriglobia bacterium]
MQTAYADGQRCREMYRSEHEAAEAEVWGGGLLAEIASMPVASACWQAGFYGHEMPRWVEGWRFGRVPECGCSHNFRDNCQEPGVSMMSIDGMPARGDGTHAMFNGSKERVRVAGWLIERHGSDGEYLLVGAVEV